MNSIAIIGGGAAGMMAALAASTRSAAVSVFERQERVGRKLSVTGNGRCNLTNINELAPHVHSGGGFALPALARFDAEAAIARFRDLGLLTVVQGDGRVYPLSDTAGSVVDVLRYSLEAAGVRLHTACEVTALNRTESGFLVRWNGGETMTDRIVIACGGCAGERCGGSVLGYRLLESFGHRCTPLRPGLVQLRSDHPLCRSLKGVRAEAAVCVLRGGICAAETAGEVQFTDYGLSGPAIFEVSRAALEKAGAVISLDLIPGLPEAELEALLRRRAETTPQLTADDVFIGTVHNRVGRMLVKAAGLRGTAPLAALSPSEAAQLAHIAKDFRFRITGDMGMANAQITVGGMDTGEFDPLTMESRLCPGLYACGEVLDVDGDCGGFNLQWAWASGDLAGTCAAGG